MYSRALPRKTVPRMTYTVSSETSNLYSLSHSESKNAKIT